MSQPIGGNAVMMASSPWVQFKRTVVAVSSASETALPANPMVGRRGIWIWNTSTIRIRVGPTGINTTNDAPLVPVVGNVVIPATDQVTVYALAESGTPNVMVWEYA